MERRDFIKTTALTAVAISASGFVRFNGSHYEGDCETTTDILGPFYRPDSPIRNNFIIPGDKGVIIELSGIINHKDCITPYHNAKIELWHCDAEGVYDNTSDNFRYRGTTFCDENGAYSFKTILPVPYDAGGGNFRPAHFHLMITAEGYQPLVTQLYFSGDEYIAGDSFASSTAAKRRVLDVQSTEDGRKKVQYNVSMAESLPAEPAMLDRLVGTYQDPAQSDKKLDILVKDRTLWIKNELFGFNLDYIGNNTFRFPGLHNGVTVDFSFEIASNGTITLTQAMTNPKGEIKQTTFTKVA